MGGARGRAYAIDDGIGDDGDGDDVVAMILVVWWCVAWCGDEDGVVAVPRWRLDDGGGDSGAGGGARSAKRDRRGGGRLRLRYFDGSIEISNQIKLRLRIKNVFLLLCFYVSCDIFNQYKDNTGSFKESLTNDVHGMLELYEAAYMRVDGEVILDDALVFTKT
nr:putative terpenoid cyclases/protein prenyltransferase alpha-alpha toroid [Tanacetum cinerariifolium]